MNPELRPQAEERSPLLARVRRALLGGLALVFATFWVLSWRYFPGRAPIHANDAAGLARFGVNEAPFLIAAAVVEAFLCAYLTVRLRERWPRSLDEFWRDLLTNPGRAYAGFGFIAATIAAVVAFGVLGAHPISEDEKTYLFQAHLLLQGRLSTPVPPGALAFWQPFIVMPPGRWSGQYGWAQPAALAPGLLLGLPSLVPPLEAAVTVYFTGKLAAEYAQDVRAGVLAAALAALSPIVLLSAGTLHNANLAATCAAATLWGVSRLARGPDRGAAITAGVATAIGLQNRPLDQVALTVGGGVLLLLQYRRDLGGFVRALAPGVLASLPVIALLPLSNHFAYGHWWRTGYAMFNGAHRWKTMGFGTGPFADLHSPQVAAAKSVTALVRMAFYATGCPVGLALLSLPVLGVLGRGGRLLAPLVPATLYAAAYFFYAASSIDPTGPVYYLALVPLLLAWIAVVAMSLHDALSNARRDAPSTELRRLVPALLCAQAVAAAFVFWPAQVAYLSGDVKQASDCESFVQTAGIERGLIFTVTWPPKHSVQGVPPQTTTWYRRPPLEWPPFDAPVLYARPLGFERDAQTVRQFAGDRPVYMEKCFLAGVHRLWRYSPERHTLAALDGSDETPMEESVSEVPEIDFDVGSASWFDGSQAPPPEWYTPRVPPISGLLK
jgi:hypothetical protein